MLLRVLALLAIVAAAARPVARWVGAGHAPTALAIVIDNSLSSSAVVNGRPLLDQFKAMARDVLSGATSSDRLWLVRIDGNVRGGTAGLLRDEIDRLEPIAGTGDPGRPSRGRELRDTRRGPRRSPSRRVTDGQRSEWQPPPSIARRATPVLHADVRPPSIAP